MCFQLAIPGRVAARAALEEFFEAAELRIRQRIVLGKDSHRRLPRLPTAYATILDELVSHPELPIDGGR
jgi:hypothetical protein